MQELTALENHFLQLFLNPTFFDRLLLAGRPLGVRTQKILVLDIGFKESASYPNMKISLSFLHLILMASSRIWLPAVRLETGAALHVFLLGNFTK